MISTFFAIGSASTECEGFGLLRAFRPLRRLYSPIKCSGLRSFLCGHAGQTLESGSLCAAQLSNGDTGKHRRGRQLDNGIMVNFFSELRADDLCGARGMRVVFEGVSFALKPGAAMIVTGPNGSGKSTLLRILAGLLAPLDGRVDIVAGDDGGQDRRLCYLGHANSVKGGLTVIQNMRFWSALSGIGDPERIDRAAEMMALDELLDLPARYLSAGQRRRLALSRFLVGSAPIWIFDEPTTALDRASTALFEDMITLHRDAGGVAVIATHQPLQVGECQRLDLGGAAA